MRLAENKQADVRKGETWAQPINQWLNHLRDNKISDSYRQSSQDDGPHPGPAPEPNDHCSQAREPETGEGRVAQPPGQRIQPRRVPTRVDRPEDLLVETGDVEQPGPPSYTPPMETAGDGAVRFVASPAGHLGPFRSAVSERTGGVSRHPYRSLNTGRSTDDDPERVRENEQIVLRSLGLADRVARLRLEHGARVLQPQGPGMHGPADALLSDDPGLALWFTVADCVPVTLTAGAWRAHGHCGWRGTAAGLIEAMTAALAKSAGAAPRDLCAWIGPGVGPCCYEVGPGVAERFDPAAFRTAPPAPGYATARSFLDLRAEITLRLDRLGLPSGAIATDTACTSCTPGRFFSHRRDGIPTGRLAAICFADPAAAQAPGAGVRSSSR